MKKNSDQASTGLKPYRRNPRQSGYAWPSAYYRKRPNLENFLNLFRRKPDIANCSQCGTHIQRGLLVNGLCEDCQYYLKAWLVTCLVKWVMRDDR